MRILLVSANREMLPSPVVPIGVLSVAASVRDEHDVEVLDLCFEDPPEEALAARIATFRPDVVAIGIRNLHTNAYDGTERLVAGYASLARTVRASTDAKLVLGGAGFSLRPDALLDALGADHGVVGEGELAFPALVAALARGETPPRLLHGAAAAPRPVTIRAARATSDLDRLPRPARDLVDRRYYAFDGTEPIQTKRGCAFACTYCDYPDLEGRKVRVRSPDAIADDVLALASEPDVSHVFFVDSVFNVPRSHALATCDALVRRGSPLPWVAYASPASLDDELVARMAQAGCIGVEIGTDTGTDAVLKRLRKPFTLDDVRRVRRSLAAHGIHDCHTFVLGAEGETVDEVRRTLAFVDELDPDVAAFIVFMEDRESRAICRAPNRDAILELLANEAPKRPRWIVPELSIRFGAKLTRLLARRKLRGPGWLHLAKTRGASGVAAE